MSRLANSTMLFGKHLQDGGTSDSCCLQPDHREFIPDSSPSAVIGWHKVAWWGFDEIVSTVRPSACSGSIFGNGQMLVMRTIEDTTNPVGKLISSQQPLGLDHFPLAVYPLGFYGVEPRTLLRQKATHDPHSLSTLLDFPVMLSEPAPDLPGDMPTGVVPDEDHGLLARCLELFAAPPEELRGYGTHRPTVHEPYPRLVDLGQVEPVAGDGLRLGVVFGDRLLEETQRPPFRSPATEGGQGQPTPPALVAETHCPFGVGIGHRHQSVAPPFFLSYRGSGEVIEAFGPHPSNSEKARKRCPDGLSRDRPFDESLLEGNLCRHLQSPEAGVPAKLPRRAVQ